MFDQMETGMSGAIVFDLDGTLVDTAPGIAASANRMLADFGFDPMPMPLLTTFIGHGIPNFVRQMIGHLGLDPDRHAEMNARMIARYSENPADLSHPYPGVVAALEALAGAGHPLGVCTNKNHGLSVQILDALDLSRFFSVVIGGDSLPVKKPDPAPLRAAYDALPGPAMLYVGDSEVDAETARVMGLPFGLFTEGYRKAPVADLPHTFAFDDFALLPGLARKGWPVA